VEGLKGYPGIQPPMSRNQWKEKRPEDYLGMYAPSTQVFECLVYNVAPLLMPYGIYNPIYL